jgi:diguanylate cyclase (GGDEF)-like protein
MSIDVQALVALTQELQRATRLEDMLSTLTSRVAALLDVDKVSVRLLDESRTRLLVGARTGEPVHLGGQMEFTLGEGLIGWIAAEAAPLNTGDATNDPRFVPRPGMSSGFQSFLGVPLMDGASCIGVLSAIHALPNYFEVEQEELLTLLAGMSAPYLQIARLRRLAEVDPLTGALNRRGLEELLPELPDDAIVSVAIVDLDHFKQVNDAHGHAAGDEALRAVSHLLGSVVRRGDAVVRLGGEEFVLMLTGATAEAAARVAERARQAVEAHGIVIDGKKVPLTVSIGVAERRRGEARPALLQRADAAMYRAKAEGRNRVCVD